MKRPRIRLVTRGDDSGSAITANEAIRDAFTNGILRNTSIMVPGPFFREAADLLGPLSPDLCMGIHVTLNAEWDAVRWGPVLDPAAVPTLVDRNGHFFRTTRELHENEPSVKEMMAEIRAQLAAARAAGLDIRYIDEHMGVGWIGGLREHIAELARAEGLIHSETVTAGMRLPTVKDDSDDDPVRRFAESLRRAAPGDYLVVGHPCYDVPEMRAYLHAGLQPGSVGPDRDRQRRLFMDPDVVLACAEADVRPIRYVDI